MLFVLVFLYFLKRKKVFIIRGTLMIKPVINTASLCALDPPPPKKQTHLCGQEEKQSATPLSKENIFQSQKKSSHAHSP